MCLILLSLIMARNEEVVEFKSENYARNVMKETCQSKMLDLISRKKTGKKYHCCHTKKCRL